MFRADLYNLTVEELEAVVNNSGKNWCELVGDDSKDDRSVISVREWVWVHNPFLLKNPTVFRDMIHCCSRDVVGSGPGFKVQNNIEYGRAVFVSAVATIMAMTGHCLELVWPLVRRYTNNFDERCIPDAWMNKHAWMNKPET